MNAEIKAYSGPALPIDTLVITLGADGNFLLLVNDQHYSATHDQTIQFARQLLEALRARGAQMDRDRKIQLSQIVADLTMKGTNK